MRGAGASSSVIVCTFSWFSLSDCYFSTWCLLMMPSDWKRAKLRPEKLPGLDRQDVLVEGAALFCTYLLYQVKQVTCVKIVAVRVRAPPVTEQCSSLQQHPVMLGMTPGNGHLKCACYWSVASKPPRGCEHQVRQVTCMKIVAVRVRAPPVTRQCSSLQQHQEMLKMTSGCCHQKWNMRLVCSMKVSPSGRVRH